MPAFSIIENTDKEISDSNSMYVLKIIKHGETEKKFQDKIVHYTNIFTTFALLIFNMNEK